MNRHVLRAFAAFAVVLALGLAACSSDDGADVRSSGSGSGSGGSSSGSGSGLSATDIAGTSDNPLVQQAVDGLRGLRDRARSTSCWSTRRSSPTPCGPATSRPPRRPTRPPGSAGRRIEPIAGLVEAIDGAVDARVDDFENEQDPAFTGWHRIEYILWEENTTEGAAEFADQLDEDLATLKTDIADVEITPLAVTQGSAELIEEVSEGKITGEEDRYSHTDLWDFAANVAGSEKAFELMKPAIEEADPDAGRGHRERLQRHRRGAREVQGRRRLQVVRGADRGRQGRDEGHPRLAVGEPGEGARRPRAGIAEGYDREA